MALGQLMDTLSLLLCLGERSLDITIKQNLIKMEKQWQCASVRHNEQQYEKEIRQTYTKDAHYFLTHSSDSLHLQVVSKELQGRQYQALVAKDGFKENDIIVEVRGSIIKQTTLKHLLDTGKVTKDTLPVLVRLGSEGLLLSPKNIAKYILCAPFIRQNNCFMEDTTSKLFIRAFQDIAPGQQLALSQRSREYIFQL